MKRLKELISFLPYYFRGNDTYKDSNGKGLLEKYLEIFGNYFEDIIVNDIKSLSDIIDISSTEDIYLGYLWEFLGQLPYANPEAIDPEKWKTYFNGLDDSTTIKRLSKYWLYPKDTVSDDLIVSESTVRNLLMYSVTLFKIRGTEKFFKTLMALYGVELEILESQSSPVTVGTHGDDFDYAGSDDDYAGSDDDYGGMVDYYKKSNVPTKIDGSGATLNEGCTMDNTSVCNTCASIHFKLHLPTNQSNVDSYISKIESVINRFLPINVRPIFEWVNSDNTPYKVTNTTILRPFVLVDTLPNSTYMPSFYNDGGDDISNVFEPFSGFDGWYLYLPDTLSNLRYAANNIGTYIQTHIELSELNWLIGTKIRVMVLILPVNSLGVPINIKEDSELNPIRFTINGGDIEYESGHIFNITIGAGKSPVNIEPKPVLLDDYWKPWYTQSYPVYFNSKLKRVSYKFGIDYNSTVITSYNYGTNGSLPILSYKEVATIVNGIILSTESSPVDFIWNNDIENPITPVPLESDPTRYRFTVEPYTTGEQSFYMVENPARKFVVVTSVNKLSTIVLPNPNTLQIDVENKVANSRLDVRLGDGSIKIPNTLSGYEVSVEDQGWFNNYVIKDGESRGLCNAFYNGKFHVKNLNSVDRNTLLRLYIPILSKPIHNNSQKITFTCIGNIPDGDGGTIPVILTASINLFTQVISFTQVNASTGGDRLIGSSSWYGKLNMSVHNSLIIVTNEWQQDGYSIMLLSLNIGKLINGVNGSDRYINPTSFKWEIDTLSYSDLLVFNTKNKDNVYNVGELVSFNLPGIYEFKASYLNDPSFSLVNATRGIVDINGLFNSDIKYTLEIIDDDFSDNRANTIRIPYRFAEKTSTKATIKLNLNLFTNLNQVDGVDMETQFPNYFDWGVVIFWGSNPMGQLLTTVTCDDDSYNVVTDPYTGEESPAEHYGKSGYILLDFNKVDGSRDYTPSSINFPPGMYTIMMHSRKPMEDQDYYQVIELYEDQDPNERQIHIDVDVISRAWLNPVGINGDIDTRKTWGYYKSHLETMVTNASYDVYIEVPEFRVLLSNNNVGYKKVWLYKALPISSFDHDQDMIEGNINYKDLIYQDNNVTESSVPTRNPGEGRAWIFTGTVYNIGELVKGPDEPGLYMLVVHQTTADLVTIGKAYLEVKEIANYILKISPTAAVLEEEDTAVSSEITVTHDAIWPKKLRLWSAATGQWLNLNGTGDTAQTIFPVTFLAYTAGVYDFTVYWYDEDNTGPDPSIEGATTHWVILDNSLGPLQGTFNVVRNTTLSPESRVWTWDGRDTVLTVDLVMVNSDRDIPWTAIISEDQ